MGQLILTRKHWEIFIGFLVCLFLAEYLIDFVTNVLGIEFLSMEYTAISNTITTPVFVSYPLLVGIGLNARLKDQTKFTHTTYGRLFTLTTTFLAAYFLATFAADHESLTSYVLITISVASFISLFSFPARRLKSIELKRNAGIWEYAPETFQFLFWPLGVWWIQPRLNKVVTRATTINE